MAHGVTFHATNAAVTSFSLLPLLGVMPYWAAVVTVIYYMILIWKEGVIQSFVARVASLFKRKPKPPIENVDHHK